MLKTLLPYLSRRCQLVAVLKVVLFLWPALLVAPMAIAHTPEAADGHAAGRMGEQHVDDGLADSKPGDLPVESDCRCDKNAVLVGSAFEQGELEVPCCAAPDCQERFEIVFERVKAVRVGQPPPRATSPPVYLATQRLRI